MTSQKFVSEVLVLNHFESFAAMLYDETPAAFWHSRGFLILARYIWYSRGFLVLELIDVLLAGVGHDQLNVHAVSRQA